MDDAHELLGPAFKNKFWQNSGNSRRSKRVNRTGSRDSLSTSIKGSKIEEEVIWHLCIVSMASPHLPVAVQEMHLLLRARSALTSR